MFKQTSLSLGQRLMVQLRCLSTLETKVGVSGPTSNPNINKIFQLFENRGAEDYFGETVTKTQHALQAATIAEKENESNEMVVACLLHDIGHLVVCKIFYQ